MRTISEMQVWREFFAEKFEHLEVYILLQIGNLVKEEDQELENELSEWKKSLENDFRSFVEQHGTTRNSQRNGGD